MADLSKPMLGPHQLAILDSLSVIGRDPALRAQLRVALAELQTGYTPSPLPANVVELFPPGQSRGT